jgi:hypothetical protein
MVFQSVSKYASHSFNLIRIEATLRYLLPNASKRMIMLTPDARRGIEP